VRDDCGAAHVEVKETTMAVKKNATTKQETKTSTFRKAPGTRLGTLQDWRGGSGKSGDSGRHGQTIRDGR
jgi:hypothetical protein